MRLGEGRGALAHTAWGAGPGSFGSLGLPGAGRAEAGSPSCVLTPGAESCPLGQKPVGSVTAQHTQYPQVILVSTFTQSARGLVLVDEPTPNLPIGWVYTDACSHPLTSQSLSFF